MFDLINEKTFKSLLQTHNTTEVVAKDLLGYGSIISSATYYAGETYQINVEGSTSNYRFHVNL